MSGAVMVKSRWIWCCAFAVLLGAPSCSEEPDDDGCCSEYQEFTVVEIPFIVELSPEAALAIPEVTPTGAVIEGFMCDPSAEPSDPPSSICEQPHEFSNGLVGFVSDFPLSGPLRMKHLLPTPPERFRVWVFADVGSVDPFDDTGIYERTTEIFERELDEQLIIEEPITIVLKTAAEHRN